jgi:hypothetical protein
VKRTLVVAIGVGALATACGGMTGEVVRMDYRPGYYTTEQRAVYTTQCNTVTKYRTTYVGSGTSRRSYTTPYTAQDCHSVWAGTVPYQQWHSSCHNVAVLEQDGKVRSRCVSETKYYAVKIGDKVEDF